MNITLQPVKSTNVAAVGHDEASNTLAVQFTSGKTYLYHGVTKEAAHALRTADSVGGHFAKHIRPNHVGKPHP